MAVRSCDGRPSTGAIPSTHQEGCTTVYTRREINIFVTPLFVEEKLFFGSRSCYPEQGLKKQNHVPTVIFFAWKLIRRVVAT